MSNNISKEYVSFAKKNIYEYLKIIMNKKFKKDIADILVEEYMSVRYYNYFEIKHKNSVTNINYYLKNKAKELIDTDNEDYINDVNEEKNVFVEKNEDGVMKYKTMSL